MIATIGMYKKVSEENKNVISKNTETANEEEKQEVKIYKEKVKKFIDIFYFTGELPSFDDINSVDEDWIWLAAYYNLFSGEQDLGMYVTKEYVENSAKDIFGENLKKEFPIEGLEFWLEPENGKYFVKKAGVDFDYINDFEITDI